MECYYRVLELCYTSNQLYSLTCSHHISFISQTFFLGPMETWYGRVMQCLLIVWGVFNWGLWLYKVVMLQFLQTIDRSSKALTCMTKLFCFYLIFLLSLQIGITPPWFATDGFSWHVTLACGWELNGPLKIHWSLASSPVLRQLLLPQGLCSCICLYYSLAHSVEYNN